MQIFKNTLLWKTMVYLSFLPTSLGQNNPTDFSTWFNVTEFPNSQTSNVARLQAEAQELAQGRLWYDYVHRCINAQKYPTISNNVQTPGWVTPARAFDSLFFVGYSFASSWAIDTGDGVILIDALNNAEEAEKVIIPGLNAFGYTARDIKALVITHEHFDHYGGAAWFQDTFNAPVYASSAAWVGMKGLKDTPSIDKTLEEGDVLEIGNTTVRVFSTPGHTPGTISLTFPVYDHGQKHIAGLYGGGGIPSKAEDKSTQIESFLRFSRLAKDAGVDVLLSNHQTQDHTLQNLDVLANRQCSGRDCNLPNPFVVGNDQYVRYLELMAKCVELQAARQGQILAI
ncbi:hypothetical protein N0V84_006187 [Fusarium piperis]|uniref:Metallo-beta-lactamase domain-containing protein n=1 Tax=Fusarium piperis TaxID=1435070 RepID=A0A9W9BPW1_9HYPO|nr:hypothetical protein N0V84_006187 [Fusarium piperis]